MIRIQVAHPSRMDPASLRGHLRLLHGSYMEPSLPLAEMHRCHGVRHTDPDPPYDVPHEHGPVSG